MAHYGHRADGSELKSQWETILYYLQEKEGRRITSWKAIQEFGFTRLSAIVWSIEDRTVIVLKRRKVSIRTRYGATVYVTEYWYENTLA